MENDIDVYIPSDYIVELTQLADIYGFGFYTYKASHYIYNICIQFEEKYVNQISDFINDVNIFKNSLLTINY